MLAALEEAVEHKLQRSSSYRGEQQFAAVQKRSTVAG